MSKQDLLAAIRQVVAEYAKLSVDVDSLSDADDLFVAGMTSFASVNVMIALEERFDVEFPDELLNRSAFASIDAMADALATISALAA